MNLRKIICRPLGRRWNSPNVNSAFLAVFLAILIFLLPTRAVPDRPALAQAAPEKIRASMCATLLSARGDWHHYLEQCAANGANTVRFFLDYVDGAGGEYHPVSPFLEVGTWNPCALAGEPGYPDVPQVDLTRKDPAYWQRLREVLCEMNRLALTPWFVFEDQCSEFRDGWERHLNSFYGNVQRYPGWDVPGYYTPETGVHAAIPSGTIGLGLNDYHYQYELWVIELCYEIGLTEVYAEPKNEFGYDVGPLCSLEVQLEWFKLRCLALRNLKYTLVIGSARPPIGPGIAAFCDLYDQHCIIEAADIERCPNGLDPSVVILDSDGAPNGTGPLASYFGWRSRGLEQAISIGDAITALGYAGFCEMPQEQIDTPDLPWNVGLIDYAPLRILALETGWIPPPPAEYVMVEVCKKTGLIPNGYCPIKEMRQFRKGEEPTRICKFHKAHKPTKKKLRRKMIAILTNN
jgi:hypothetical protein